MTDWSVYRVFAMETNDGWSVYRVLAMETNDG